MKGKIRRIYHLSDIHIRNYIRHEEYLQVFQRVYDFIEQDKDDNSVIVLVGDIVHAKTDMSPEATDLQRKLYKGLADLCPLILITGNHDCNLNNRNRLDALSPTINAMNHPNIYYWKDTGVYEMGGITFSVMSVFDSPDKYIPAKDIESDYKIALFHGAVNGSKTDIGFEIKNDSINVSLFNGFDLTLLGDIHKPAQYLNEEKTIAYVGSLCQQNHSEGLIHGLLVWDIETKTSRFQRIENDYGYYTIEIDSGEITTEKWKEEIPKKVRLRLLYKDTTPAQLKHIISEVAMKSKILELSQRNLQDKTTIQIEEGDVISRENILDVEYQNQLLAAHLINSHELISDETLNIIFDLNRSINSKLDLLSTNHNVVWKPKRFEFSNMFSYGKKNVIDFTDMSGLNGIFAPNAHGKSSILSALVFCLFDKCDRTGKASDIMNNQKDWFSCKFEFEMNSNTYIIERNAKVRKVDEFNNRFVTCDVDFWMIDSTKKKINLNGEQRDDTNKIIRSYIGTYDDFILTSMSLQADNTEFVNSSQRSRKDILSRFLDIWIYDKLYNVAKNDIRETEAEIKILEKMDFAQKLATAKTNLISLRERYDKLVTLKEKLNQSILQCDTDILEYSSKLKPIDESLNLTALLSKKKTIERDIEINNNNLQEIEFTIKRENYDTKIKEYEVILSKYNLSELEEGLKHYKLKKYQFSELKGEYEKLTNKRVEWQNQVRKLATHEYDPDCQYCIKNEFVKAARDSQKLLDENEEPYNTLKTKLTSLQNELNGNTIQQEYDEYIQALEAHDKLNSKIELLNEKKNSAIQTKTTLNNDLKIVNEKIKEIEKYQKIIEQNSEINSKLVHFKEVKRSLSDKLKITDEELLHISGQVKINEKTQEESESSIIKLSELYDTYSAYEYYLSAIKHDGIPYTLIEKLMPTLENAINNILQHMVDFTISIFLDGKYINAYIDYGDGRRWPVEMTSGMERFITSVAIRVALTHISNLPRPNFLGIDEGFGVLDSENLSSLHRLFGYLNSQFSFVLCISHLSTMRDLVDDLIEVQKIDGFSKIRHTKYLKV